MQNWIMNLIVEMLLKAVTDDKIDSLAEKVKSFLIPFLQEQKEVLIDKLMQKAASTSTEIDDAVYHALGVFLDSFIPAKEDFQKICSAKSAA